MFVKGLRIPSGGSAGDAYTAYTGMKTIDASSIKALFNDAELSPKAVRSILHPVFTELQAATARNIRSNSLPVQKLYQSSSVLCCAPLIPVE
ncbi:hypothetical protein BDZ97DRAFT_1930833 [Flammula alnicola]|nr:hypothetical protein BDZ97DRAFT_1930833 [Flammula alnicola]